MEGDNRATSKSLGKISRKSQAIWCTQVARLLESGISLNECLDLVIESQNDKKVILFTQYLRQSMAQGESGYATLTRVDANIHHGLVTAFEIGEVTGTLSKNLKDIGQRIQSEDEFAKKIISLLIYPTIVSCAALGMIGFLIGYIFPKIMPIFIGMKMKLPLATRAMILLVNIFQSYWWLIVLVTALSVTSFMIALRKSQKLSKYFSSTLLKIPYAGANIKMYHIARLVRFLSTYIASGQSLSHALRAHSSKNIVINDVVASMTALVENGNNISSIIKSWPERQTVFPKDFCAYISIGERSGSLLQSFELVTEIYERKIKSNLESLTAFIEPGLMIFIGIFVGWISMSIILPMYQITEHVGK